MHRGRNAAKFEAFFVLLSENAARRESVGVFTGILSGDGEPVSATAGGQFVI
jgi:hypothetical protein